MFEIHTSKHSEKAFLVTIQRSENGIFAIIEQDAANTLHIPEVYTFDYGLQTATNIFENSKEEIEKLPDGLYAATAISDDGIHYRLKLYLELTVEPVTVSEFIDYALDAWPNYNDPILHNKHRFILDNVDKAKSLPDCEFIVCCQDGLGEYYGKYYDVYNNSDNNDISGEISRVAHTLPKFVREHHFIQDITPTVTLRDSMTFVDLVCACASFRSNEKIFGSELVSYMEPNAALVDLYDKYKKKSTIEVLTRIRGISPLKGLLRALQNAGLEDSDGTISSNFKITKYNISFGRSKGSKVITVYDAQLTIDIYQYLFSLSENDNVIEQRIQNLLNIMNRIDYLRGNTYYEVENYLEY